MKTVAVETRLKNKQLVQPMLQAMLALQGVANQTKIEKPLLELVKTRASQINRCAFCLEMHTREAVAQGEVPKRLHLLAAWEEVGIYTARERAALRWTEAVTKLSEDGVSDEIFAEASGQFSEQELLELTMAVVAINGWNRCNVAFRVPPGGLT
ncbi:MAG: carboxymuconolactone decarboxylase family protein [Limisphaerales bacterium]